MRLEREFAIQGVPKNFPCIEITLLLNVRYYTSENVSKIRKQTAKQNVKLFKFVLPSSLSKNGLTNHSYSNE